MNHNCGKCFFCRNIGEPRCALSSSCALKHGHDADHMGRAALAMRCVREARRMLGTWLLGGTQK